MLTSTIYMFQETAHVEPKFSARLFGAGLNRFALFRHFSSFECQFCPFTMRYGLWPRLTREWLILLLEPFHSAGVRVANEGDLFMIRLWADCVGNLAASSVHVDLIGL